MRYRNAGILILILIAVFWLVAAQTKDIAADGKTAPTEVKVSSDDLIALNGALTAQQDAVNRRDKALRELQAAMNDLDKANEARQTFAATLPKGAEPVRNAKGAIVKFQIPAPAK